MKTGILISSFLLFSFLVNFSFGQTEKDTLFVTEIYQDVNSDLIIEKILIFDSLSKDELIQRFENWGGQNFRNYEAVRTAKTESQITLTYITSSFAVIDMYLILIAEFKDNKIRIRIYDDGNVFKPGYYIGQTYTPAIQARQYKVKSYFSDNTIIFKIKPGAFNIKEKQAMGAINYNKTIEQTVNEIEKFIKSSAIKQENDNW